MSTPPLWREAGVVGEIAALRRSSLWRGVPIGGGRRAVVIPGFGAGTGSVSMLVAWLRRCGFVVEVPALGRNTGCSGAALDVVLEMLDARGDAPAVVVGHSRGGQLGRAAAGARPDAVSALVTMGTPQYLGPPPFWFVQKAARAMEAAGRTVSCVGQECCAGFRSAWTAGLPPTMPYHALWSPIDGVAGAADTLRAPGAEMVEVRCTHTGFACSAASFAALSRIL